MIYLNKIKYNLNINLDKMNNNPAKDRFWEYLSKKIGKEKANEFMYTPEKSNPPFIFR